MDQDRLTGKVKETVGKGESAIGDAVGDPETQASGRVREAAGAAQNLYGQAKDSLSESLSDVADSTERVVNSAREAAQPMKEALEREVAARPLIALLIAALVGYVLAQLTSG